MYALPFVYLPHLHNVFFLLTWKATMINCLIENQKFANTRGRFIDDQLIAVNLTSSGGPLYLTK